METSAHPASDAADWRGVVRLLEELSDRTTLETIYRDFADVVDHSSYRDVTQEEFLAGFRANIDAVVEKIRQRRGPNPGERVGAQYTTGRSRAQRGVSLSDFVRVTLEGSRAFTSFLAKRAREVGLSDESTIEVLQYFDEWSVRSTSELITGYQEVALADAASSQRRQYLALRKLLGGGLTAAEVQQAAADSTLSPNLPYYVLRAATEGRTFNDVRRALLSARATTTEELIMTTMYGDVCAVSSEPPSGEIAMLVGVSPPVDLAELDEGFRLATRSVEVARQVDASGFVSLSDLSILATLVTDQEVVTVLSDQYLRPLQELGATGEAVLDTVSEYVQRHRNVAETAQALFVHANTVRYRIERFEELTQSSLRSIRTLAEVWWILHRHTPSERLMPT